jgi:exopolysaccharide production protein ExoQ
MPLIETIAIALVISAVMSALLIAFFPDIGRQAEMNGLWEGATVHKNILGIAMVQGLITMACIMDRSHGLLHKLEIAAMVLFAVLLAGSGSVSSMVVAALLFFTFFLLRWSRATGSAKPAIITLLVAAAGAFGALISGFDIDQIFGALGKDPTLSGRTELWQFALDAINLKPILGYGYDVFFNPATPTGEAAIRGLDWDVNIYYAHNGFLEATLGLGLIGLVVVVAILVIGLQRTAVMFWQGRDLASLWPLLTVIYTLFSNITEAGIARVNDINWIIFIVAYLFATDAMQQRAAMTPAKPRRRYA